MTHGDAKAALTQQRSALRRSARGKARIGDDMGSAAGHEAERAKARRLRERLLNERKAARLRQPLGPMVVSLVLGMAKLAGTFASVPIRLALALRGRAPGAARA